MNNVTHIAHNQMGGDRMLVTHTDLDGIGCAIIFLKCFPKGEVLFCDYDKVNESVMGLIQNDAGWNILITDISVNKEVAALLDRRGKVGLLDHHHTAKWLMQYSWANVDMTKCGTRMIYEMLSPYFHIGDYEPFVDVVEDWDLTGWQSEEGKPSDDAIEHEFLLEFIGRQDFITGMLSDVRYVDQLADMVEYLYKAFEDYYNKTLEITQVHLNEGYRVGISIADRYQSLMGNQLINELDLEYIMLIDPRDKKASLRGRGNVHLGELAMKAGGGGHARAAGFPLGQRASELVTAIEGD
jgi:oligoribonuclease NrnB/cAMP/cGMP phosphodiesterase (DHH superfamily)